MSKTYFGRCAAVGIAGLTAMSSIAIVASAATQASVVYELKYNQIDNIGMVNNAGYATGTNQFCVADTAATDALMNGGFVVKFSKLSGLTGYSKMSYTTYSASSATDPITTGTTNLSAGEVWSATKNFQDQTATEGAMMDSGVWTYKEFGSTYAPEKAKFEEIYEDRGTTAALTFHFKSESERSAAKTEIKNKLTTGYNAIAKRAYDQFVSYINAQVTIALAEIEKTYEDDMDDAAAYSGNQKSAMEKTAAAKRTAARNAVNDTATIIKNEFKSTFTASNFRIDTDGLETSEVAIVFGKSFAGTSTTATLGDGGSSLVGAKYYSVATKYKDEDSYAFKGEIQIATDYVAAKADNLCINGNDWLNFEVIDYSSGSGGNTTPSGGSTSSDDDTTTVTSTTWYPDSSAYRAASEVSYLGKNGVWYTSASAATLYGGGYTGTSKNSNYSTVNSTADGKTIYFDSTSGTYSTSATSYSYVVKEGSSTANDPYYTYFFGTTNNTTTTTVPAGSPAISGASKYAGWTNISAYITNRAKSGATYTINMNDGTVVPSAVLDAAKAKNVTLVFANDNGSKVTVKPGKISSGTDLNVAVTYNVKDIKTSLVNKAKKVNAGTVSTAQVRIGSDGSIGGTETVNVKFSTKRAGCTVKAYRLTASGSLVKEATGTVASTGRVNLNLTKGGSYLLVVID